MKPKLLGIEKSEKHNIFILSKVQAVIPLIRGLFKLLETKHNVGNLYNTNEFARPINKDTGEPVYGEDEDVSKYTDKSFRFKGDSAFLDIIFGKEKVFIIINTEEDIQQDLSAYFENEVQL